MSREEIAYQIFIAVVVGLLVLCCLIPFLYVVGMSFTSEGEMIQRNFFVIIPQKPILAAYEYLLKNKDFFSGMGITIVRTAMGVCTALILTVPVGYILAIGDLPFKNGITRSQSLRAPELPRRGGGTRSDSRFPGGWRIWQGTPVFRC